MDCYVCGKKCKNFQSFTKHVMMQHKLSFEEVRIKTVELYPELFKNCITCGVKTKYAFSESKSTCSDECCTKARIAVNFGRVQSKEVVAKRIASTDQLKKESTRHNTMMEKYGSLMHAFNPELRSERISKFQTGRIHTKEQHQKITLSKIKNGTIKHSDETKEKIRERINARMATISLEDKIKMFPKQGKGGHRKYETGYFGDIWYRSSYEKNLLESCKLHNIQIISAANLKFAMEYYDEFGKKHAFYPDFYLPELDFVVECKNPWGVKTQQEKLKAGLVHFKNRFLVLECTSSNLSVTSLIENNLEYLLSRSHTDYVSALSL